MKILKRVAFSIVGVMICLLTAATLIEKFCGTEYVVRHIYSAPTFVALWAVLAATALVYILRWRLRRAALLLHLAFAVILLGAFISWLFGQQGTVHMRTDIPPVSSFISEDGFSYPLPFQIRLDRFQVEHYPGTRTPMDFVATLTLISDRDSLPCTVSMNSIVSHRFYRLCQASYDADMQGSTLSITYDPWGICITYAGYLLLLIAMMWCLLDKQGRFRSLLRHRMLRSSMLALLFIAAASSATAAEQKPRVLPRDVAAEMGMLHVYYNDRVCPLGTLANELTTKLYGKRSYRGYTPEQVLSGWLFYYDDWKHEPMIRIKNGRVRDMLEVEGRYARLVDFRNAAGDQWQRAVAGDRASREANEKFNLVRMLCGGNMLRLFPYTDPEDGVLHWASQVDDVPHTLPYEQWMFIRRGMDYANELIVRRDYAALSDLFQKIGAYQAKECGSQLPSRARFNAERLYNRIGYTFPMAIGCVLIGFAGFAAACRRMMQRRATRGAVLRIMTWLLVFCWSYLTLSLALRGYVSGHWPMSNGFETMQTMAWCSWLMTLLFHRRFVLLLPMGFLVGGLAVMVSVMGQSNPQITPLMPVLNSPLLSIHVMLVMAAYSLLALLLLNGVAGLVAGRRSGEDALKLQLVGQLMLYPALFFLAAGIFVGAVWANVSWGRYWGWDPKEVWALITLMVYSLALHTTSLPWFRRPAFFHVFCIAAFLTVLITYFGVNFLLGGMHSYAG
ncbi:cytochrome c biogenesis protein CcsA [uncultured Alistipes sp.]|uniref:cytochrome c biogenesis protein n=1 Tax=uncultured Alistipes sp. TaxID=538949 RepID=UPI0025DCDA52|nr:cytochrome c biogenesis protein CcsA [uncultured Alistipes sp.]